MDISFKLFKNFVTQYNKLQNDFIQLKNELRANGIEHKDMRYDQLNQQHIKLINDYYTKPRIKYVITLDSDTNLILGSALELIGAMAHILNRPVLNKTNDAVIEGHSLIQPRVGINLEASRKSIFTKIYAGLRWNRFLYKCHIRYISRQF